MSCVESTKVCSFSDELFQVTITALEESRLLVWHRDKVII